MKIHKADLNHIKNKPYIRLKCISVLSIAIFLLLLITMIINITVEYGADINTLRAFLHGLIYAPLLIGAITIHILFRRKLKQDYSDRIKSRTGKENMTHIIAKTIAIIAAVFLILLVMIPYAALPMFMNRHVNYRGYATFDFPLQDVFQAADYNLKENQMYLKNEDGLNIWVSEIYYDHPKAVIIYLSGIVQPSVTYFYGHAKFMQEKGYSSILLEVRGHGKSDGNRICLGYDEVNDVKAVVDYIKHEEKYKDVPIVVQGASMGGAIAVNAFGQIKDIDALIAMSAYSSFEDVVLDELAGLGVPVFLRSIEKPLFKSSLKLVYGSNKVDHIKPVEQIKNADGRPVFLIASKGDTEVPAVSMHRLKKAYPDAEVWLRNSWEHFIVKDCDFKNVAKDEEYCRKVLGFLENEVRHK
ncbi:alpha/beta hydrolase [Anaerocolumna sp. MB42-C2]|uniref:alpha/beta hydrolase n=1 Tax=Anaerocolumna sp. MB42-C2 TaxID=3070997 RepID=UPI0027E08708|nr:alpha/beta fold hydrolase [Anaerocolumna sp. MB42-C2]WMJ90645.1 alpha/beta fold hydrolase [Anaerocolumna sp. MB42-C2]